MNSHRTFRLDFCLLLLTALGFVAVTQTGLAAPGNNIKNMGIGSITYCDLHFGSADLPPLPPNFFFLGSLEYADDVEMCDGADDDCDGNLDGDELDDDVGAFSFVEGINPQTYEFDINTSLSFHSANPITISDGGGGDVFYDVILSMILDPGGSGTTTITPGLPGGDFIIDSFFDVEYVLEFIPLGGSPGDAGNPTTSSSTSLSLQAPSETVPATLLVDGFGEPDQLLLGYDGSQFNVMDFQSTGGGFDVPLRGIPEPATLVLALCGAALWSLRTRKHRV